MGTVTVLKDKDTLNDISIMLPWSLSASDGYFWRLANSKNPEIHISKTSGSCKTLYIFC